MAGYVIIGTLAAFGLLSALWVVFGWLLVTDRGGWLLYPGWTGKLRFVRVYLWLRGLGMIRAPLILMDLGLDDSEKRWLSQKGIEYYPPEKLPEVLIIGAETN